MLRIRNVVCGVNGMRRGAGLVPSLLGFVMPRGVRVGTILAGGARPVRRSRVSRCRIGLGYNVEILDPGFIVRKPLVARTCDAGYGLRLALGVL